MGLRHEGYWEQHYEEELKNFQDNGDEGDVWFGEPLTRRIVNRILQEVKHGHCNESSSEISILDVGCGNAFLLCTLLEKASEQLTPGATIDRLQLHGIDYSANSIELSKKIVESRGLANSIHLQQCNFLDLNQVCKLNQAKRFDFIVDKGTFDAICLLSGDADCNVRENYKQSIYALARSGTVFILASCNHTEDELLALFDGNNENGEQIHHQLLERIETPKIRFGGKEGSQVCCLVLKFN